MTNKEIAKIFQDLGNIMELHNENPYKIRSYQNAYVQLRKLQEPIESTPITELAKIRGIGKAIQEKITEILETNHLSALQEYQKQTPVGVQEMLNIKGFGPKKIRQLWTELHIESIGELLYACNENRLIALKGFGEKTQKDLEKKATYFLQSRNKFHYASLEEEANALLKQLRDLLPEVSIEFTGAIRRKCVVLEHIEVLVASTDSLESVTQQLDLKLIKQQDTIYRLCSEKGTPITIYTCQPDNFGSKLFQYTGTRAFLEAFLKIAQVDDFKNLSTEMAVFEKANVAFIPPELRETTIPDNPIPRLIEEQDIVGVLHAHTTYSDGLHSLEDMARYAQSKGYAYIGITDHSKSAFYANGLQVERLLAQMKAIDSLNETLKPFKIFKGIESDILYDGSLDYSDDILRQFDFIIASVHSQLRMDKEKATERLLKAIENPYTTILGHPTGRLLLSREGYPLDHQRIIEACAAHNVVIELNANPYRLDLDWRWISFARSLGVKIAINPDAHSKEGIHDIRFGVYAARKGGLSAKECLNHLSLNDFELFLANKKS